MVLAEYTTEITIGEENRPGTMSPDQRSFLPVMWALGRYHCMSAGLTEANLPFEAVHIARPRTKAALREDLPQGLDPLL